MHRKNHLYKAIFYTLSQLTMVALAMGALPAWAQQVFPNAREAAKSPAVASRLAHPATPRPILPATRQGANRHPSSPQDYGMMYENGPVNGTTDAWSFSGGFQSTESLTVSGGGSTVNSFSMWVWIVPGDSLTGVQLGVGTGPFDTSLFNAMLSTPTTSNCFTNQYGYNVCEVTWAVNGPGLYLGNYWVTLQNGTTAFGTQPFWDENSGVGCTSSGCPSTAMLNNGIGTIPSEAFTLGGSGPPPPPQCFQSEGNLQIIHDFTPQEGGGGPGPIGVTIDRAGNLYGTTYAGGDYGAGLVFKLNNWPSWFLERLYSFWPQYRGKYDGFFPSPEVIVGPNGDLFGGAEGGLPNCDEYLRYCGMVFELTAPPTACRTARCSWREAVPYAFEGGTDAWGANWKAITVSAFDRKGNLYGRSERGGTGACENGWGCGTVFKLTPSGGGWTESVLYSFTGGSNGYSPTQVLVGNDGNLYGIASADGTGGIVFQLTPSGDHWVESVLHSFQGTDGFYPSYLVQDDAGNLYGIAQYGFSTSAPIFMLSKSGDAWVFSEYLIQHPYGNFSVLNNLAIDTAGNLYGTGYGGEGCGPGQCSGKADSTDYSFYSFAFKASHGSDGWQYQDLVFLGNQDFSAAGDLALDAQGNLYGTTMDCGSYGAGTVWQLSP